MFKYNCQKFIKFLNKKMEKTTKSFQQGRPSQLKIKQTMFQKLKSKITHHDQQQIPHINIHQEIQIKQKPLTPNNLEVIAPESSRKRSQSVVWNNSTKRLKLKDYIRLNQITRQKRSSSMQSVRSMKNSSLNKKVTSDVKDSGQNLKMQKKNLSVSFNLRQTFGPQGTERDKAAKKQPFKEQIKLQKTQLLNTAIKAKQKLIRITQLIKQTQNKFQSYKDLVFMFKVQQIINECIVQGIQSINSAYVEHFAVQNPEKTGIANLLASLGIISASQQRQSMCKSPVIRAEKKTLEDQKNNKIYKGTSIVPVSSPKSQDQLKQS